MNETITVEVSFKRGEDRYAKGVELSGNIQDDKVRLEDVVRLTQITLKEIGFYEKES